MHAKSPSLGLKCANFGLFLAVSLLPSFFPVERAGDGEAAGRAG